MMDAGLRHWLGVLVAFASGSAVAWVAFLLLGAFLFSEQSTDSSVAAWLMIGSVLGFPVFAVVGKSLTRRRATLGWWAKGLVVTIGASAVLAGIVAGGYVSLIEGLGIIGLPLFLVAGYSLRALEMRP